MKIIKLLNLKLVNFKGVRELEIAADGNDLDIFGKNEAGKTTIVDGFTWALFNKGSEDEQDFGIKTLKDGEPIHNLNHEVEVKLSVSDPSAEDEEKFKVIKLKKVFKENWTQKRGSATKEFTGHTTKHFINDVPVKKTEYDKEIQEIIETEQVKSFIKRNRKMKHEEVFKLLTVPGLFNNDKVFHWKNRRDFLLEITGEIDEKDILESDNRFEKLIESLKGNSVDDHKLVVAGRKKEINQRLKVIPELVSENHLNMPDLSGLKEEKLNEQIDALNYEIDAKEEQINAVRNGSKVNELKRNVSEIDLKITNVRNEHTQNEQEVLFKLKTRLQEENSNLTILRNDLKSYEEQKQMNESRIKDIEQQMESLRDQYRDSQQKYEEHNSLEFDHDNNCVCPTCEQHLPQEKVDEAVAKFNKNKADLLEKIKNRLDEINNEGRALKEKVKSIQKENESIQKEIDRITEQGKEKANEIKVLEQKVENAASSVKPIEENRKYIELINQKEKLEDEILAHEHSAGESIRGYQIEIAALKEKQKELQIDLSKFSQAKTLSNRIEELENEQKYLAAEYESLEHQDYLIDEFTKKKVSIFEENVSKFFEVTHFKMFKKQINGGLDDCCVATYKGVPHGEGMNDGAKVNVGLDIINVLSKHFGVQVPIFFDNAEQVTSFFVQSDAQLITLNASKEDPELRIEVKDEKGSAVA